MYKIQEFLLHVSKISRSNISIWLTNKCTILECVLKKVDVQGVPKKCPLVSHFDWLRDIFFGTPCSFVESNFFTKLVMQRKIGFWG